jgi:hypothetical protein
MLSALARMPNALCLVCGTENFDAPISLGNDIVAATSSCIVIGCRPDCDAPTEFVIGALSELAESGPAAFTGTLCTPERIVSILNAHGERILSHPVSSERVEVSIWADDQREPDRMVVGLR